MEIELKKRCKYAGDIFEALIVKAGFPIEVATDLLNSIKDADVAPVVHGRWKLRDDGSGTCSECRFTQKYVWDYDNWQNYCGVCGAKMDLEPEV
jgi:hypothetical protein